MKAIFETLCPNCGGPISDLRLSIGAPCRRCLDLPFPKLRELHDTLELEDYHIKLGELLEKRGKFWKFKKFVRISKNVKEFSQFFTKVTGKTLWSAQKEWARRVFKNLSFSINAPTGVGKTVFGISMSLFLATKGKKSYFILPTQALAMQVYEKAQKFAKNGNLNVRLLFYRSKMRKKEKEEFFQKVNSQDFDILITTSKFLSVNFDKISNTRFDLIFVDDVDAVLKSSKNIDKILYLIGTTQKEISLAMQIIKLKKQLPNLKYQKPRQKLLEKIKKLEEILEKLKKRKGILIVSTATGKARGDRVKLFREILNFTVGSSTVFFRNIVDFYLYRQNIKTQVLELVKKLGKGGLIFVGIDDGSEFCIELAKFLKSNGINAEAYVSGVSKPEILQEFAQEKIDILVGVASYYGILVRGIDLPHIIRYAIFTSVPKFKFNLRFEEANPFRLFVLLSDLVDFMPENYKEKATELIGRMKQTILDLPRGVIQEIGKILRGEIESKPELEKYVKVCREAKEFLREVFKNKEFLKNLERSPYFSIREIENERYILIPDVRTYIQASGRTSRLFAGGVTKGISILIVDDEKVFRGLERQLRWYYEEAKFEELDENKLKNVLVEVDRDRELVRKIIEGRAEASFKDPVKSALLIVESPHKAETIASFFGRPSRREVNGLIVYEVTTGDYSLNIVASKGHVFDLVEDKGFYGVLKQDNNFIPLYDSIKKCLNCGYQFVSGKKCPKCGSENISDARDRIEGIREIANEVDIVFLGTDPDTEGEKISWDLFNVVKTSTKNVKRLEFHEVTRRAIKDALKNLRDINENLVNAQIVRRIEDRWLGFKLSEIVQRAFKKKYLSAGRVQTPVLGWIIKRYDEFKKSWKYFVTIQLENGQKVEFEFDEEPREFVEKINQLGKAEVIEEKRTMKEINPLPPFTTDTLLTEASRELKFSAPYTMQLAQNLFESGLITYHRTDSTRVSLEGMRVAKDYISDRFSEEFYHPRKWLIGKEGAHECIRPVRPIDAFELKKLIREGVITRGRDLTNDHFKLYDLIFKRFMASQMKSAKVEVQEIKLKILDRIAEIEQIVNIVEDGFNLLVPLKVWKAVEKFVKIVSSTYAKKPKILPYTQGEIIKEMKERGIGRPSTYATIIKKLFDRKYVIEKKGRVIPTNLGRRVYYFLTKNYGDIVSEKTTRELEKKMDMVEEGYDYRKILAEEFKLISSL